MHDVVNPLQPCEVCKANGYFSHKFQAVLCDRHYFERNGKSKVQTEPQPLNQGDYP